MILSTTLRRLGARTLHARATRTRSDTARLCAALALTPALALGACASDPSLGERLTDDANTATRNAELAVRGERLIERGERRVERGRRKVSDGEGDINDGRRQIAEGEELVRRARLATGN